MTVGTQCIFFYCTDNMIIRNLKKPLIVEIKRITIMNNNSIKYIVSRLKSKFQFEVFDYELYSIDKIGFLWGKYCEALRKKEIKIPKKIIKMMKKNYPEYLV